MQNLSNIGVIKDILNRHGFSFSKGLGQNFLINPSVCPRMAEMSGAQPGWGMIEIGAGFGVLTVEPGSARWQGRCYRNRQPPAAHPERDPVRFQ